VAVEYHDQNYHNCTVDRMNTKPHATAAAVYTNTTAKHFRKLLVRALTA
jgi:hypothetical protein